MISAAGTKPPGTSSEEQAARWVQRMFAEVATKYDFLNHLLSFTIDRSWRKALMKRLAPALNRENAKVLDLCCGTGDVLLDLQQVAAGPVLGADFCHPMLIAAGQKARERGFAAPLFEADALQLPVADNALDAISIAFGFRNLANYSAGFLELYRVLKPDGILAILEFSHPRGRFMKTAYGLYSRIVLPVAGQMISGSREAYSYLPESIRRFPQAAELRGMMDTVGFVDTKYELLTDGVAALHVARKSNRP